MSHVRVRPSHGFGSLKLAEVIERRDLLYFLAWRDVKVRYKQTLLGAGWAVLQPLILMVLFTVFLGRLAHIPSDGLPYGLFAYSGLVLWTLVAQIAAGAATSLVDNAGLVSKVYFPRLILPLATAGPFLVDFTVALVLLAGMTAYEGVTPGPAILWAPAFVVLALVGAFSVGILLSALNVRYRDVRYAVPFLVQVWLFASPVAYPASMVPERWRWVYALNPAAGAVSGWRWAVLGAPLDVGMTVISVASGVVLLALALAYFARTERTFAEVI